MIDKEVRYRAVVHYEHFLRGLRKVAKLYGVSRSSLHRWISSKSSIRKVRTKKQIRKEIIDCIDAVIKHNPCSTMKQVCEAITRHCQGVSQSSVNNVGRWVKSLGFTRKKVYSTIEYSPSKEVTDSFCNAYKKLTDDQIICIDEAGFYVGSHGRLGWSRKGTKIHLASYISDCTAVKIYVGHGCRMSGHYSLPGPRWKL